MSRIKVVVFLIIISTMIIGCVDSTQNTKTTPVTSPTQFVKTGSFYNFEWFTIDSFGYYDAPRGYTYAIITLKIDNTFGNEPVSTSGLHWKFVGENGIEYPYDSATYSDIIAHQSVDVSPGYTYQTEIVYLIDDDVKRGRLIPDFWFIENPILDNNLEIDHPEDVEPEPTQDPNIRGEIIIPNDFSEEKKFEYWFEETRKYYNKVLKQRIHPDLEILNDYANKDLEQIDEFELSGAHEKLRLAYKDFLEPLADMDERDYEAFFDDGWSGSVEQVVQRRWTDCNNRKSVL